jgi:hypothetical protein
VAFATEIPGSAAQPDVPVAHSEFRPVGEIPRSGGRFEVVSPHEPAGDQPAAIDELERRIRAGEQDVVLLGATGTGKSATTAWLIERVQRPTLVMAPNKTLAAQLANELREMLPNNAVEYFVSYYDYYQPEAYIAQTDTYIEKDSSINEDVERLRHSATMNLLSRRDVVVVASVSCIYGLGTPQSYLDRSVKLKVGGNVERDALLRALVDVQYTRNDLAFNRGTFRVRGDTVEIIPAYEELALRIEFFGDEVEALYYLHPLTGEVLRQVDELRIFPATHYVAGPDRMVRAVRDIEAELAERLAEFENQGKLLEAQRLKLRTEYDMEMIRQVGFCSGIENYSRHIDGRGPGTAPRHPHRLLPRRFPARHRRVAPDRPADRRDVRGRHVAQAQPGRVRVPAAVRGRQPPADVGGVRRSDRADGLPLGHAGPYELTPRRRRVRRAGHPAHGPRRLRRSWSSRRRADRRPRSTRSGRAPSATSGCWSPRSPRRWPRTSPTTCWSWASGCATCTRGRHAAPGRAAAGSCGSASSTCSSASTCLREGLDLPGGVAGRDPRRRQGGLPPLGHLADPDDRARGAQRVRARCTCTPTRSPSRCSTPSTRPTGGAPSRWPTTRSAASTRSRCGRRSPTSSTRSTARPRRCRSAARAATSRGASGPRASPGRASAASSGIVAGRDTKSMPRAELADLVQQLSDQMLAAARDLQFELAARLRDEIADLKKELRGMDAAGIK